MVGRLHSCEPPLCGTLAATRLSDPRDTEVERGRTGTGPLAIGKNPTFLPAPKEIAIWIMYGSGQMLLQSGLSRATGTVNVHPLVFSKVCHVDGKKGSLYRYLYRLKDNANGKWHFLRLDDKGRFVLLPLVVFFYPAFSRCCRSHEYPSISFCTDFRTFYPTFADVDSRHSDDSCNSDIHNRAADALRCGDMYIVLMGIVMSASDHTLHGSPFTASSVQLTIDWLELFSSGCITLP
ncbi:uncharacterized protein B0T23DRAFT_401265 [Neurospora hispaniola]|uniref:Uncharacterized protein n=1 Tax=Neurospora hispaniola TaxID=588809 RepID=A0AAJ0IG29_9PEZI|nr:hypothetical protein B0T23DRAFT_401265 [Neurospora hispaniola]